MTLYSMIRYKSFWRGVGVGFLVASIIFILYTLHMQTLQHQIFIEQAAQPGTYQGYDDWAGRVWYENFWSDGTIKAPAR